MQCSYPQVYQTKDIELDVNNSFGQYLKKIQELNHVKNLVFCDDKFVKYRHNELTF